MKNQTKKSIGILFACLFPILVMAQTVPQYQESEGIIVIEIESATNYGSWVLDTAIAGYTGDAYLQYTGPNFYNNPGNSLLNFEISIEKTGKYRFQWHSRIAVGNSQSEHNDSWLRFQDASDFYGEKNGQKVYPKGIGKTPNPNGSSANGWMKIYQNNPNNWSWKTRTSDNDPHEIYVEFDTTGIYTLEISGRSNGHAINRLALFHSEASASQSLDLTRPESELVQAVGIVKIPVRNLKIRPTLAKDLIYLDIPQSLNPGEFEGEIINLLGQKMRTISFPINGKSKVVIPIAQLARGIYFIRFQKDSVYYQGKFMKQ